MPTGHLHHLKSPSQWVPVLDAFRHGTPPLSVRALVTHAAVPATLQFLKIAVLQRTVDVCRLDGGVDRVCAGLFIPRFHIVLGLGAV